MVLLAATGSGIGVMLQADITPRKDRTPMRSKKFTLKV
jgi:hypothetical protein